MKAAILSILIIGLPVPFAGNVHGDGAVGLLDSTDIEIKNNLTAKVKLYKTIEITSEAGAGFAEIMVPVNDFIEIEDIRGYTILPGGRKIKLKSSDIKTASIAEIREFGGYRVVLISLRSPVVGARLHYQYTLKIKSLLYLPRVIRREPYKVARYVTRVRWGSKVKLNYDYGGFDLEVGENRVKFFADDLPGFSAESNSCPDEYYVMFSADRFKYRKKKYPSLTWPDVSRFFISRSRQSDRSLSETAALARRLVKDARAKTDSVKAIFDYVADSVAYVSLELGKSDFDPHYCDLIIDRQFGDCKDQSVLLTSLYNQIGFQAHPVLVATGDYLLNREIRPWPAIFDHVAVSLETDGKIVILDPSRRHSLEGNIPSDLRGRLYLVVDGHSDLRRFPEGRRPSKGISWSFVFDSSGESDINVAFELKYYNEASEIFGNIEGEEARLGGILKTLFRQAEWHVSSLKIENIIVDRDTLAVSGGFTIDGGDLESPEGISVGSPILVYLLEIFSGIRSGDYCRGESYQFNETITVNSRGTDDSIPGYNEVWVLDGLEFSDGLSSEHGSLVYRREFSFDGGRIPRDDYNAFRDFILSMRNQRYVHHGE